MNVNIPNRTCYVILVLYSIANSWEHEFVRTIAFRQQNKVRPNISGFYFGILQRTIFGIFSIESACPKIRVKMCILYVENDAVQKMLKIYEFISLLMVLNL